MEDTLATGEFVLWRIQRPGELANWGLMKEEEEQGTARKRSEQEIGTGTFPSFCITISSSSRQSDLSFKKRLELGRLGTWEIGNLGDWKIGRLETWEISSV